MNKQPTMLTCQKGHFTGIFGLMSIPPDKMAEMLALPEEDRAFLALRLIASLDDKVEPGTEAEWNAVIDRRSREMVEGPVKTRSEQELISEIRAKLRARHSAS